jgi:hypothetical protein
LWATKGARQMRPYLRELRLILNQEHVWKERKN